MDPILIDIPERLEGEKAILRAFESGDGTSLWEAIEESREHLRPWQTWQNADTSPFETEARVRRIRCEFLARRQLYYAIVARAGSFLGWCGLEHIDWRVPFFQIGYRLRKSAIGKGFATEAVALLVGAAFTTFDAKRVALWIDARNERSIAVAQRLRFVRGGRTAERAIGCRRAATGDACLRHDS